MSIICKLFGHKMGYLEGDIYSRPVCARCKHVGKARAKKTAVSIPIGGDEVLLLLYSTAVSSEAKDRLKRDFDEALSEGKASIAVIDGVDSWTVIKRPK